MKKGLILVGGGALLLSKIAHNAAHVLTKHYKGFGSLKLMVVVDSSTPWLADNVLFERTNFLQGTLLKLDCRL